MLRDYLIASSLNSLFFTGLLLLTIFIIIFRNFKELMKSKVHDKILLLCLLTIAIGSHGLIHLGVETQYGFNPYRWF